MVFAVVLNDNTLRKKYIDMKQITLLLIASVIALHSTAQNVGIGTTTPTRAKLEVNGAPGSGATSGIFGGDGAGISLQKDWPSLGFNQYRDINTGYGKHIGSGYAANQYLDPSSGALYIDMLGSGAANTEIGTSIRALQLSRLGNVAIKDAYPNSELQLPNILNNRKITLWESANNTHQYFGLGILSGTMTYNVGSLGDKHSFFAATSSTSSKELMSIWGNGKITVGTQGGTANMGINSYNPANTLEIMQDPAGGHLISGDGRIGKMGLVLYRPPGTGELDVDWGLSIYKFNSNYFLGFFRNGILKAVVRTDGTWDNSSDKRLKKNIEPIAGVLDKVMQLKPVNYNFKDDPDANSTKRMGFLAQDVQQVFPQLVTEMAPDDGGPRLGLSYAGFGVIAIKAIQEQQQQIEALKKEIQLLKEKMK